MSSPDPFMTLVDAATAIIDKKTEAAKPETLSINSRRSEASVTQDHDDPSTTPPPGGSLDGRAAIVSPSTPRTNNRTSQPAALISREPKPSFARILMDTLLDDSLSDIITFLPDGDAFAILEPKLFQETVMEERFGIKTFSPFVRKLHRWGFERIMDKKTHAVDVFRHPLFIRGNYHLCDKIRCIGRLVKGPLEEAILTQAGINNKTGMSTHQEIEIRNFVDRMELMEQSPRPRRAKNNTSMAQAFLVEQAVRQEHARRQEQKAQEALIKEQRILRAQREVEARQMLVQQQQQMAVEQQQQPTVSQLLLASLQSRNREEELIAQELKMIKQEELLRQQIAREANLTNSLQQQVRLQQELLSTGQQGYGNRMHPESSRDIPLSALWRASLQQNNSSGASSLAAQLRQYM